MKRMRHASAYVLGGSACAEHNSFAATKHITSSCFTSEPMRSSSNSLEVLSSSSGRLPFLATLQNDGIVECETCEIRFPATRENIEEHSRRHKLFSARWPGTPGLAQVHNRFGAFSSCAPLYG